MAVIFSISSPLARAETAETASKVSGIGNFRVTEPPKAISGHPIWEDGETERTMADYQGKVVVLNFWARWCAPCLKEMPSLDRLQAIMGSEGVVVLPVSLDRIGVKSVIPFYERTKLKNLPVIIDRGRKFVRKLGVRGLPTTIIVDPMGREVGRLEGPAEWDSPEAQALIRRYLKKS